MNKDKFKETIYFALYDTVEDHPAAFIISFIIVAALLVMLILTSPILTILASIIVLLLPPIILIFSFVRNYYRYKKYNFND